MTREIVATITSKGQVTIPREVRQHLGVGTRDQISFVIEGEEVRLRPVRFTLESVFGSVKPLPGTTTADFDAQIEEAKEERADELMRKLGGR